MITPKQKSVLLLLSLVLLLSCEKLTEPKCYSMKIIQETCGGTVIQFVDTRKTIGEEWTNFFDSSNTVYQNCALCMTALDESYEKGDVIYASIELNPERVEGNFCAIGGLPNTYFIITEFYDGGCQ